MKHKEGSGKRCFNPKARTRVYLPAEDYYAVPGRHGIAWEHMGEGLTDNAAYDPESMALVRSMGGIRKLVNRMMPMLSPQRKALLIERFESMSHAMQRSVEQGKALSKAQKRKLKAAKKRRLVIPTL